MISTRCQRRSTLLILGLILLCGLLLRTCKIVETEKMPHDDVISYLVATGHLDTYHQTIDDLEAQPVWQDNRFWQAFLRPGIEPLSQSWPKIISDLEQHDIHPPLYFLWLNLVLQSTPDTYIWSGWLSNSLFYLINGVMIFLLGRRLLPQPQAATLGVFIWTLAVPSIETGIVARHYELMTSISLLSLLVLARTYKNQHLDPIAMLLFGILTLVGFLTNYQYLYFGMALSCIILSIHRHQPWHVFGCGLTIGGAILLGLWLYPALIQQSQEVRAWSTGVNFENFLSRLRNTTEEPLKFSVFPTLTTIYLAAMARPAFKNVPTILYGLAGLNFAFIVVAYLGFIAPIHAMGDRYLATFWPLLALILGQLVHYFWNHSCYRYSAIILICLPALLFLNKQDKHPPPPAEIADTDFIIADFNERGIWPTIAKKLRAGQRALVAPQSSLLRAANWRRELEEMQDSRDIEGILITSHNLDGNSRQQQQRILALVREHYDLARIKHPDRGLSYFRLKPLPADDSDRIIRSPEYY